MTFQSPEAVLMPLDLTVAGETDIDQFAGVLRFVNCEDTNGALNLTGKVSVRLGQTERTLMVLRLSQAILMGRASRRIRLSWEAQAGLTATFMISPGVQEFDMDATPPAQLVTGDLGTAITAVNVAVGTSEVLAIAANANRKSVIIKALSTNTGIVYLGPTGLATSDGMELVAGASFSTQHDGAAYYAIASAAGQAVRVLEAS